MDYYHSAICENHLFELFRLERGLGCASALYTVHLETSPDSGVHRSKTKPNGPFIIRYAKTCCSRMDSCWSAMGTIHSHIIFCTSTAHLLNLKKGPGLFARKDATFATRRDGEKTLIYDTILMKDDSRTSWQKDTHADCPSAVYYSGVSHTLRNLIFKYEGINLKHLSRLVPSRFQKEDSLQPATDRRFSVSCGHVTRCRTQFHFPCSTPNHNSNETELLKS